MNTKQDFDRGQLFQEVIDYVLPLLPPYQFSLYLYLLRHSRVCGSSQIRVGKRTIGAGLGKSTRSSQSNYQHIGEQLEELAAKGFIEIGDSTREGTVYLVKLPIEVPPVQEKMVASADLEIPQRDFYTDPELREQLFIRDGWICRYCGDVTTAETATLDHVLPASRGGTAEPDNLATCCFICNSIKSGRTYEQAAPDLLRALRHRRSSAVSPPNESG
ncbi:MAG: HNH endonuclease signature motif containing protein [Actinomycetota bacterium]